jgi:hypothetical protein
LGRSVVHDDALSECLEEALKRESELEKVIGLKKVGMGR